MVEKIDENSQQLAEALDVGHADHHHHAPEVPLRHREDRQAARAAATRVIVDEAHSSQTGEAARHMKEVLAAQERSEDAEQEERATRTTYEDASASR